MRMTNCSRVGGVRDAASQRERKRCQRKLMGLSTWTRMKRGRRERTSTHFSLWMEVVTKLDCQCWVAKSSRSSTVAKVCGLGLMSDDGTWASEALFSTLGVPAGRAIFSGRKSCCSMRYCWIDDLPAQIPIDRVSVVCNVYCLRSSD